MNIMSLAVYGNIVVVTQLRKEARQCNAHLHGHAIDSTYISMPRENYNVLRNYANIHVGIPCTRNIGQDEPGRASDEYSYLLAERSKTPWPTGPELES